MLGYAVLPPAWLDIGGSEVSNSADHRSSTGREPERRMQNMREIVTAILGLAIVLFTLALTGLAFSMVGEGSRMQDAITVLTLLFGLAGVVVGYYFGRVPAEARAAEAHARADIATEAMDHANRERTVIIDQAANLHDEMEGMMDEAGLTPSMLQNHTMDSMTSGQREQIKEMLVQAQKGISRMTKTAPSSA